MTFSKATMRLLLLSAVAMPTVAVAQEPAADSASANEIIVTAQRRGERLQDIPATISAMDSKALVAAGVSDIQSVGPRVPGFYTGGFGTARPQLYIRGIGTRQFDPGSESSVGVFVDESYLGRSGGVLGSMRDVERIEVLKGPQGTLYGRNTIGGAVNVITKAPTSEFSAEAEATYGNYNYTDFFGVVSGPIAGEALKARLAVWKADRRGYMTNLATGAHPQGLDQFGARLRFEINPSDNIKIDLIGDIMRDNGRSFQGVSVGSVADTTNTLLGDNEFDPTFSDDPYKQYYDVDPEFDRNIDAFTGKVDINLGGASLVSVTSYRKLKYADLRDFDNTDLDVISQETAERSKQWSQELRLVSDPGGSLSLNGVVDWIIGAYYYHDKSFHADTFRYGPNSVRDADAEDTTYGYYKTKSLAFFGQATFHLNDIADLTFGARYTEDKKQSLLGGIDNDGKSLVAADFEVDNKTMKFTSFDPKVTLSVKPNRNVNIYASYSQGFKSGGYQYTPLTAAQAASVYDPEEIDAYEVGVKAVLAGGLARVNGALYYYDYKNLQVSTIVDLGGGNTPSLIDNAGTSEIKGGELEVTLEPAEGLMFNATYAYTDAKYESYLGSAGADYSGSRLVRAPKHSINLSGQYELPLSEESSLTFRADLSYMTKFNHEPIAVNKPVDDRLIEDGYTLLNGRITYDHGPFYGSIWGKNITDKLYRRSVLALPGQLVNYYAEPATYGVTVGFRY